MRILSKPLCRNYFTGTKRRLLAQLDTTQPSPLSTPITSSDYYKLLKSKDFEITHSENSRKILMKKKIQNELIEVHLSAQPIVKSMKFEVFNFQVTIQKNSQVSIFECVSIIDEYEITNAFVTDFPRTVSLVSSNKPLENRGPYIIEKDDAFKAYFFEFLKTYEIDDEVVQAIVSFAIDKAKEFEAQWFTNIKKFLISNN